MDRNKCFAFLIISVGVLALVIDVQSSSENSECIKEIHGVGDQMYIWKHNSEGISNYVISKPPCIEKDGSLLIRECTSDGIWKTASRPQCDRTPQTFTANLVCPEGFKEILIKKQSSALCVSISKDPEMWSEKRCFGSDTIFDLDASEREQTYAYLSSLTDLQSFWIPVHRANYSNHRQLLWKVLGEKWGDQFTSAEFEESPDKNCLIAIVGPVPFFEMTHCNDTSHFVCIYKSENIAMKSTCGDNYGALKYEPNTCYGIEHDPSAASAGEHLNTADYFKNRNALRSILLAIDYDDDEYFSINSKYIGNQNFTVIMNIKEKFKIGYSKEYTKYLARKVIETKACVEMFLQFDSKKKDFKLIVYNRDYIYRSRGDDDDDYGIKCFTETRDRQLRSIAIKHKFMENFEEARTVFTFKPKRKNSGYYWCEAHVLPDLNLVKSGRVTPEDDIKRSTFVVFFDMPCATNTCSDVQNNMQQYNKKIKNILNDLIRQQINDTTFVDFSISTVEAMAPGVIDSTRSILSMLCHVSASLEDDTSSSGERNSEDNFINIDKTILKQATKRFMMRNLLSHLIAINNYNNSWVNSTTHCFPELLIDHAEKQWYPVTIGQISTTRKFCLQQDGLPLTKKCIGNSLYGADWKKPDTENQTCLKSIRPNSITQTLYEIDKSQKSKDDPKTTVETIKTIICKKENSIIPADLHYLGNIMTDVASNILSPRDVEKITPSPDPLLSSSDLGIISTQFATDLPPYRRSEQPTDPQSKTNSVISTGIKAVGDDVISIYNKLMQIDKTIVKSAVTLNSTNVLVDAFERLVDELYTSDNISPTAQNVTAHKPRPHNELRSIDANDLIENIKYEDGSEVKLDNKLVVFVLDPHVANISGVALYNVQNRKLLRRHQYRGLVYKFLYSNQSVDDLMQEKNLEMATFIPQTLLNSLTKRIPDRLNDSSAANHKTTFRFPKIVIKIYSNDQLFQEDNDYVENKVYSMVISISLPKFGKTLPEPVPLVFRTPVSSQTRRNDTEICGYWNYSTWAHDGLQYIGRSATHDELVRCDCHHLTPFAFLIGGTYNLSVPSDIVVITNIHIDALDTITLLGCSLSIIGVIGIFITAITFQSWRKKASSRIVLQLSVAIALQMIIFCFINTEEYSMHLIENEIFSVCVVLGACLHYFVLVQFCWMMIIAYLQFKRYVKVLGNTRPERFFIKSFIVGWLLPLIPVFLVILLDRDSYIPQENAGVSICYPTGKSLYFGVILPVTVVIIGNLVIFITVTYNITHSSSGIVRHHENKLIMSQVRLSILLFFLLGFTWIFGLLSALKAGIVFSYLFCLTATTQGFVLFIYFILLDPATRSMWKGYLSKARRPVKENDTKVSSSTL